jgi:plastocyanin
VRRNLVTGALLATIVLAGCGGDDAGGSAAAGTQAGGAAVEVWAEDIRFAEERYAAIAGEVEVGYHNDGSIIHTLVIEDVDGFELEVEGHGDDDRGTVDLEAGTYTIYCDVAGHREAGMEATLEVG